MSNDLNVSIIECRLVDNAEMKYSKNGKPMLKYAVATNHTKDQVSYFDCIQFGDYVQKIAQYMTKGKKITIQGELKQNRWKDQSGKQQSKTEINVNKVSFHADGQQRQQQAPQQTQQQQPNQYQQQPQQQYQQPPQQYQQPTQQQRQQPPNNTQQQGNDYNAAIDNAVNDLDNVTYDDPYNNSNDDKIPF